MSRNNNKQRPLTNLQRAIVKQYGNKNNGNGNGGRSRPKARGQRQRRPRNQNGVSQTQMPVASSFSVGNSVPTIQSSANRCRVLHKEMVGNIVGTVAYTNVQYAVNPGMPGTFPWLSGQAFGWESYRVNKMSFLYVPRCAFTETGSVIIAPDYDASDSAPQNAQQHNSMRDAKETGPQKMMSVQITPRDTRNGIKKFIRTGALRANSDITLYDACTLNVATEGTSTNTLGRLWVIYDITFETQQMLDPGNITFAGSVFNELGTGMTSADIAGTDASQVINGRLGITVAANVFTVSGLSPGQHYVVTVVVAGATITSQVTATYSAGFTSNSTYAATLNAAATLTLDIRDVSATAYTGVVTIGGAATLTTPVRFLFLVSLADPFGALLN